MKKEFSKEELKAEIAHYLKILYRKSIDEATNQQMFQALSYALKDDIVDKWIATHKQYEKQDVKTVYYLSMEFLTGRALGNIIINLKANDVVRETLNEIGFDLDAIEDVLLMYGKEQGQLVHAYQGHGLYQKFLLNHHWFRILEQPYNNQKYHSRRP